MLLSTPRSHSSLLFPTPVGKSFTCNHDIEVALSSESQKDISASVLLRAFRIQPFIFKNDEFGPREYSLKSSFNLREKRKKKKNENKMQQTWMCLLDFHALDLPGCFLFTPKMFLLFRKKQHGQNNNFN